jgi:hypothetical protein
MRSSSFAPFPPASSRSVLGNRSPICSSHGATLHTSYREPAMRPGVIIIMLIGLAILVVVAVGILITGP